jgi:23S rRNA (uracil1939-C5)-methyltransferase
MSDSNAKLRVTAQFLAEDGRGIAQVADMEVHVSDLLPGEEADVLIDHRSKHHKRAWAHIAERVGELSKERRPPACPAFGECGGCAWQHLAYSAQLAQKRARVERALLGSLPAPPEIAAVVAAAQPLGYRNKGKYVFGWSEGAIVLGAYKPRTHEVVSTLGCQIVEEAIDEVARELAGLANHLQIPVYDEKDPGRARGVRYAILRSNQAGSVLVTLVCTSDMERDTLLALAQAIHGHRRVVGVLRCDNDLRSGALLTDSLTPLCGQATIEESIVGVKLHLGAGSFWQVHRNQAELAYRAIASALPVTADSHVLELFSGTGGIAFALAAAGHQVLGIERSAEAVATANAAAAQQGLTSQVRFQCKDATQLSQEELGGASAVVVDPPRKGLGPAIVKRMCEARPVHIAYLSCGPESLARDLGQFAGGGYRIESVQLFDFMPGTAQVESLAILRRED